MQYVLAIHKDPGSDYGVTVPNLPGCFSAGATLDAAVEAAREAILLHLEGMDAEGIEIQGRALEELQADPEFAGAVWVVLDLDENELENGTERVNVTLPARLLRSIDRFAETHGETRSGFLARAARKALHSDR
jgi:predicted RNase H-like HicB family nuclease